MKVAVQGCCHGQLDAIYEQIQSLEKDNEYKVDLLLIGGDLQAARNHNDLHCLAIKEGPKSLGGFHRYYSGEKLAPILTIVIGGNHEASNYLWELFHGGWLAPNIYYLGFAGCVRVNGLRIAGISGIYNRSHYRLGHFERLPFTPATLRSIYHTREYEILKLSLLASSPVDIFMSHDWPKAVDRFGDFEALYQEKPTFREDGEKKELGSPPLRQLLTTLKPKQWLAAHMHVKFSAVVSHHNTLSSPPATTSSDSDASSSIETRFQAFNKCTDHQASVEVLTIEPIADGPRDVGLTYDAEWLAISRALHPYLSLTRVQDPLPKITALSSEIARELDWVKSNIGTNKPISDVQVFCRTAPRAGHERLPKNEPPLWYTNSQTEAFCAMLQIQNKINPPPTDEGSMNSPLGGGETRNPRKRSSHFNESKATRRR
ncbi:Metallophos-domain-containing protein [Sistotremastrum suecicum HHB10207 ss-3]|uniref:Metallophos-domain-containing protein n=1 Tax=Sistotremastrum suecicum HHB10207 ss-3 TaxID=1314776 RepID=A0A166AQ28_9AGAM|nr:Metallophos-domain-containing protein [Sistotremastrum suecicum HHB10207 ss-3]